MVLDYEDFEFMPDLSGNQKIDAPHMSKTYLFLSAIKIQGILRWGLQANSVNLLYRKL